MTPPSGERPAAKIARIKGNLYKIIGGGGTEDDANRYLASEGVSTDEIKNSPVASPGEITGAMSSASAYKPTFVQRSADLATANFKGTKAPALPENASAAQRALDWLDTFGKGVDTTAHGFAAGLTDEAAGAGRATGAALLGQDPGEAFKGGSDAVNARVAQFREANPLLGATLETLGMAASPLSRLGAESIRTAPTLAGRTWRGAVAGGAGGAVTGAAYSEGDLADRGTGALLGAMVGAPFSAAAVPLVEGATRGAQTFAEAYRARQAAAADPLERARQMVAAAIARDQMTPIPQPGEALVSAGGPNMTALGRQATVAPGNARAAASDYFAGAAADRPDAIGASVQQNISGNRMLPTIEALDQQQRAASRPAYDAFEALSPDAFDTPFFRNLLGGQTGRTLIRDAYDLAELEQAAGRIPDNPMQYLLDAEGNVSLNQAPTPRAVDMMKQAIDKQVEANTDPVTGRIRGPMGNGWERLRRSFLTNADTASTVDGVSLYQTARNAYAGPAQLKDALRLGSRTLTDNRLTSEKAQAFNEMTPPQQEAFRTGLAEAAIEKAGKMGPNTDPVQVFLKGQNANELMRLYLGDQQAFDAFVRTLQQEQRIVQSSRTVMGGSPTSRIDADKADAAAQEGALTNQLTMARDAWNLATGRGGGRVGAAINLTNRARNKLAGVSEPVADELGRMLFTGDAAANRATVQSLGPRVQAAQVNLPAQRAAQEWMQRYLATYGTLPPVAAGAVIGAN